MCGNLRLLQPLDDLVEFLLGRRAERVVISALIYGVPETEGRADDGAGLVGDAGGLGAPRLPGAVLLAQEVVLERVLAVVRLLAGVAELLEEGLVGLGGRLGAGLEDLVGESLGRDGRQRGDPALEVVAAAGGDPLACADEGGVGPRGDRRPKRRLIGRETYCQSLFM